MIIVNCDFMFKIQSVFGLYATLLNRASIASRRYRLKLSLQAFFFVIKFLRKRYVGSLKNKYKLLTFMYPRLPSIGLEF